MQQKQENVHQIGLLQNNTLACVSKSVLFKHIKKKVCKCAFIMLIFIVQFNTNALWNVQL